VHAIQLELAQRSYMQEVAPYALDEKLVARLKPVLAALVKQFMRVKPG
jgi:N-formylglutamate deformylase